jgi:hypothetical protein
MNSFTCREDVLLLRVMLLLKNNPQKTLANYIVGSCWNPHECATIFFPIYWSSAGSILEGVPCAVGVGD